jgi:FkbM family methyltransferase
MRHVRNWQEIWPLYFSGQPFPSLRLRCGLTLHHGNHDGPVATLLEIFGDNCYARHLKPRIGDVIVDVGANIGVFSLYWANRAKKIRIHAYEPNPETHKTLKLNVESNHLNEQITVFCEGVGSRCAQSEMWTNVPSLVATGCDRPAPTPEAIPVRIQIVDLNEVVKRAGPIELLKIDTEGAEAEILEGASLGALKQIRHIVLEYHENLCPSALVRCQRVLEEANYTCIVEPELRSGERRGLLYASRN